MVDDEDAADPVVDSVLVVVMVVLLDELLFSFVVDGILFMTEWSEERGEERSAR